MFTVLCTLLFIIKYNIFGIYLLKNVLLIGCVKMFVNYWIWLNKCNAVRRKALDVHSTVKG